MKKNKQRFSFWDWLFLKYFPKVELEKAENENIHILVSYRWVLICGWAFGTLCMITLILCFIIGLYFKNYLILEIGSTFIWLGFPVLIITSRSAKDLKKLYVHLQNDFEPTSEIDKQKLTAMLKSHKMETYIKADWDNK